MKPLKRKVVVIVEKTNTGFSAFAANLDAYTTGKNVSQLQENILEALSLYYEDKGFTVEKNNIVLQFDLQQFFQYYKVLNSKHLAQKIGMNPTLLSQYVQGRKKPSLQQSERIIQGIRQIGKELSELTLTS